MATGAPSYDDVTAFAREQASQPRSHRATTSAHGFILQLARPALAVTIVTAALLWLSPNYRVQDGRRSDPFAGDYLQEWVGGRIVRDSEHSRLYDQGFVTARQHDPALVGFAWDHRGYFPMVYPPFYYAIVSPLSVLPYRTAAIMWMAIMAGCFVATAAILMRAHRNESDRLSWFLAISVLFMPLIESLNSGQKSTLLLLLFTATYALLRAGRPLSAGFVFGLLAFKPHLAVVIAIAMLWKRQWRFLLGAAGSAGILATISVAMGIDVCSSYLQVCLGMGSYVQTGGYRLSEAHSWWGAMQLMLTGAPTIVVKGAALALTIATLILLSRTLAGRFDTQGTKFPLQYAALVIVSILVSPHLLTYDLTLLILPLCLVVSESSRHRPSKLVVAILAALLVGAGLYEPIANASHIQPSVWLMLALLAGMAVRTLRGEAPRYARGTHG